MNLLWWLKKTLMIQVYYIAYSHKKLDGGFKAAIFRANNILTQTWWRRRILVQRNNINK